MEIREIGKLLKTSTVQKNTTIQAPGNTSLADSVTLSAEAVEAKKKIDFVAMLKAMPERKPITSVVAHKIYEEIRKK